MVIVKIKGGLGNQMFGYAYAKALHQHGYDVKLDTSAYQTYTLHGGYLLDHYQIDLMVAKQNEISDFNVHSFLSKIKNKLHIFNPKVVQEKSLQYDIKMLNPLDNKYIDGYFQTEQYFTDIRALILKQFALKTALSNYSKKIENQILQSDVSISLHVRRGDYTNNTNMQIHGVCNLSYYQDAIKLFYKKFDSINFFIFSDDMNWVRENLNLKDAIYVHSEEKRIPHEDIYLMSLCKHNIIANSSFSWWGAWLNKNDNKIVLAPIKWFADQKLRNEASDIIPTTWIKL